MKRLTMSLSDLKKKHSGYTCLSERFSIAINHVNRKLICNLYIRHKSFLSKCMCSLELFNRDQSIVHGTFGWDIFAKCCSLGISQSGNNMSRDPLYLPLRHWPYYPANTAVSWNWHPRLYIIKRSSQDHKIQSVNLCNHLRRITMLKGTKHLLCVPTQRKLENETLIYKKKKKKEEFYQK